MILVGWYALSVLGALAVGNGRAQLEHQTPARAVGRALAWPFYAARWFWRKP